MNKINNVKIVSILGYPWAPIQPDCQLYLLKDNISYIYPFCKKYLIDLISNNNNNNNDNNNNNNNNNTYNSNNNNNSNDIEDEVEQLVENNSIAVFKKPCLQINIHHYCGEEFQDVQLLELFLKIISSNNCWKDLSRLLAFYNGQLQKRAKYSRDYSFSSKKQQVFKLLLLAKQLYVDWLITILLTWFNTLHPEEKFVLPDDCQFLFTNEDGEINKFIVKTMKKLIKFQNYENNQDDD